MRLAVKAAKIGVLLAAIAGFAVIGARPADASTAVATTTQLSIASSANPQGYGQLVVLTATVTASDGTTPNGSVTFDDGTTALGTVNLDSFGQASLSEYTLPVGTNNITASYNATTQYSTSTSSLQQVITVQGSTTMVLSAVNPATFGQTVTFVLNVSASAGIATPTGQVILSDGGASLGTATLDSSGNATFATASLSLGSHNISASYVGDGNFAPSSAGMTEQVNAANAGIALTSSSNPSVYGSAITLTATATGTAATPAGSITFSADGTPLATVALAAGTATFSVSSLGAGAHTLVADYSGDTNYGPGASPSLTQTVNPAPTTTTLSDSPNGGSVNLTAAVTSSAGAPNGTVTFFNGSSALGTASLNASGVATLSATLSGGSNSLSAQYNGSANFASSTSNSLNLHGQAASHSGSGGGGGGNSSGSGNGNGNGNGNSAGNAQNTCHDNENNGNGMNKDMSSACRTSGTDTSDTTTTNPGKGH